jgi:cold shock CspA family protein
MLSTRRKGMVRWFNAIKGSGFVTPDIDNEYIFFHQSPLKFDGYCNLNVSDSVEFDFSTDGDGCLRAVDVTSSGGALAGYFGPNRGDHGSCGGGSIGSICTTQQLVESQDGSTSTAREQVCRACTIPVASVVSEAVAHDTFDKMLHKKVIWDKMLSNCDRHVGLLQQLATGAEYSFDEEIEPITKLDDEDKPSHVSSIHLPLELSMAAAYEVLDGMPLLDVVWDDMPTNQDIHHGSLAELAQGGEYHVDEEKKPMAEPHINIKPSNISDTPFLLDISTNHVEGWLDEMSCNNCTEQIRPLPDALASSIGSMLDMLLQIFTVPTLTTWLMREVDLLGVLGCLTDMFLSCIGKDDRLQANKWGNLFDASIRLLEDTCYVLSHKEVSKYVAYNSPDLSRSWIKLLSLLQGMDPQKRVSRIHAEHENEHLSVPFLLGHYLGIVKNIRLKGSFSPPDQHGSADVIVSSTTIKGMETVENQWNAKVGRVSQEILVSIPRSRGGSLNCAVPPPCTWLILQCLKSIEIWLEPDIALRSKLSSLDASSSDSRNFVVAFELTLTSDQRIVHGEQVHEGMLVKRIEF